MRPAGGRGWRAGLAAVLTAAMAAATFPQFVFGVLGPVLAEDFSLSRTALGTLTTTLFLVGAACTPASGAAVDRWGARRALVLLFVATAAGLGVLGVAASYAWLLVGAAVAGVGLSISNPATNTLLARHVPEGERGLILGVKQSGVPAGAVVAGALLPVATVALGWRVTVLVAAALPILALMVALRLLPRDRPAAVREAGVSMHLHGRVGWLAASAFCIGVGYAPVAAYLPLYAHEELGLTLFAAGLAGGVAGGAGVAGRLLWGWLVERQGSVRRVLVLLGAGAAGSAGLVAVAAPLAPALLWVGATLLGLTAGSWMVVGMLAGLTLGGLSRAGRSSATISLAFHAGFVPGPALFGSLADATGSYLPAWGAVAAAFACSAMAALRLRAPATAER